MRIVRLARGGTLPRRRVPTRVPAAEVDAGEVVAAATAVSTQNARSHREAHLPAEHPPPCPQARFPRPDAHTGRSLDHQEPPAQGSDAAVGLIGRLGERREFERLTRDGHRARSATLWCRHLDDPAVVPPRVAFAIGRDVGPAVVRNRLRRRLRELVRSATAGEAPLLACGLLLVGARPSAAERSFAELGDEMKFLLEVVTGRRGVPA